MSGDTTGKDDVQDSDDKWMTGCGSNRTHVTRAAIKLAKKEQIGAILSIVFFAMYYMQTKKLNWTVGAAAFAPIFIFACRQFKNGIMTQQTRPMVRFLIAVPINAILVGIGIAGNIVDSVNAGSVTPLSAFMMATQILNCLSQIGTELTAFKAYQYIDAGLVPPPDPPPESLDGVDGRFICCCGRFAMTVTRGAVSLARLEIGLSVACAIFFILQAATLLTITWSIGCTCFTPVVVIASVLLIRKGVKQQQPAFILLFIAVAVIMFALVVLASVFDIINCVQARQLGWPFPGMTVISELLLCVTSPWTIYVAARAYQRMKDTPLVSQ